MIFWIAPAFKLAPYALGGLDYLRKLLFPPAPPTIPAAAPFTPPFTGGQCTNLSYTAIFRATQRGQPIQTRPVGWANGKLLSIELFNVGSSFGCGFRLTIQSADGSLSYPQTSTLDYGDIPTYTVAIAVAGGGTDSCGNIPNPNPSLPIADDGIGDSTPPNLDAAPIIIEAVPPIILPSFAAALAAALAAARNALDALDAIKAVARAIEALSDLLNKKNAEENKKEKEKKENQDTIRYEFGSIQRDGFLRLYPDSNLVKYVAQQLDISFITIPPYLGKYFGKFSPNYYRYKPTSNLISSLGYISFVSPTFGILSTHHLEFRRTSIKVPENSIGFYYHLGLNGALTANAFVFYTKPKP